MPGVGPSAGPARGRPRRPASTTPRRRRPARRCRRRAGRRRSRPRPARSRRRRTAAPPCAGSRRTSLGQRREDVGEAGHAVHHQVRAVDDRRRALVGADAHLDRGVEAAGGDERRRARRRRRGRSRRRRRRARPRIGPPASSCADALALVHRHGRADLQHLAAPVDVEALRLGASWATPASHVSAASSSGAPRQWNALIGPLSSTRTRSSLSSRASSRSRTNPAHAALPAGERLQQLGSLGARRRASRRRGSPRRRSRPRRPAGGPRRPAGRRRTPPARSAVPARPSSRETSSRTCASSGRSTIGARVPSMSQKTAARVGSAVSGRRVSASESAVGAGTA